VSTLVDFVVCWPSGADSVYIIAIPALIDVAIPVHPRSMYFASWTVNDTLCLIASDMIPAISGPWLVPFGGFF